MDADRFDRCAERIIQSPRRRGGIGTLSEKTLHAVLKEYFQPFSDCHEIKVGGFVADIVGENGITEIQTQNLAALTKKLDAFLPCCRVTVVHPIITETTIVRIDETTGEILSRRKSPKRKSLISVFNELYPLRGYISNENFSLCVCLIKADVIKNTERKRYAVKKLNTVPTELCGEIYFHSPDDYKLFLPEALPEPFTSAEFSAIGKTDRRTALSCLNTLTAAGLVKRDGKKGNAILFSRTES